MLRLFVGEFGLTNGSVWFAQSKTCSQAQQLHRKVIEQRQSFEQFERNLGTNLARFSANLKFAEL